jgi:O-antigen/teichoic acid export membrane protein
MSSTRNAILWASIGKMLGFATAFATSIIIARFFLGPEEVGLFSIAFAATALIAVMQEFGLNRYIVGETEMNGDKLRIAFSISLLVAWGIAALILLAAWPMSLLYGDAQLLSLMLVIGVSYFFVPLAIVPTAMLHRRMDFRSDFLVEISAALANAATSLSLAAAGWGAIALAFGALAQQVARALVSQWRSGWMFPWPFQIKGAGPVLRFGGGSTLLQIFDSVGARAPDLIVGGAINNYAVGIYSRGSGLAVQIIFLITGAVNSVFYPALAKLRKEGEPLGASYIRIVAGYTGIVFPAMAGIAIAAYPLVLALYGERWVAVAPVLSILALAQMIIVALPLSVQIPILLGQLKGVVKRSCFATLAMLVLFAIGTHWGIIGAAFAYIGYALINALLYAPFLNRLIDFSWHALFVTYAQSLCCTVAAVAPLALAYRFWTPATQMGFGQLLILILCGVLSWIIALYSVRHPIRAELEKISGDFRRRALARQN